MVILTVSWEQTISQSFYFLAREFTVCAPYISNFALPVTRYTCCTLILAWKSRIRWRHCISATPAHAKLKLLKQMHIIDFTWNYVLTAFCSRYFIFFAVVLLYHEVYYLTTKVIILHVVTDFWSHGLDIQILLVYILLEFHLDPLRFIRYFCKTEENIYHMQLVTFDNDLQI